MTGTFARVPWSRRAVVRRLGLLGGSLALGAAGWQLTASAGDRPDAPRGRVTAPLRLRVRPLDLRVLDAHHDLAG